jgi:hypothetical protein
MCGMQNPDNLYVHRVARALLPYLWDSHASAGELMGQLQQAVDVNVVNPRQARGLKRRAAHLRFSILNLIRSVERNDPSR